VLSLGLFFSNPESLILDEPTAGLDPIAVEILESLMIKKESCGEAISHYPYIFWNDLEELRIHAIYIFER